MSNKWNVSTDSNVASYASMSDNDSNNNHNNNNNNNNNNNKENSGANNSDNSHDDPSSSGANNDNNNENDTDYHSTGTVTPVLLGSEQKSVKKKPPSRTGSSDESVSSGAGAGNGSDEQCNDTATGASTARPAGSNHRRHNARRSSSRNICNHNSHGGSHASYSSLIETKSTNSLNSIRSDGTKRESQVESSDIEIRKSSDKISTANSSGKPRSSTTKSRRRASKTSSVVIDDYSQESINELEDCMTTLTIHEPTVQLAPLTPPPPSAVPPTPPLPPQAKPAVAQPASAPPAPPPSAPKHIRSTATKQHKQIKLRTKSRSKLSKSKGFSLKVVSGGTGTSSTGGGSTAATASSANAKSRGKSTQKFVKKGKIGRQSLVHEVKSNELKVKTYRVKSKSKSIKPKSCSLKLKKKGNVVYAHAYGEMKSVRNPSKKVKSRENKLSPTHTPTSMKVQKFYSELPKPKAKMRPLTPDRIKQFSTPNFLMKYRTAVKEMKIKEMKRKTFSTKTLTAAIATTAASNATTPSTVSSTIGQVGEKPTISATAMTAGTVEPESRPENKAQHKITKLIVTNSALVQNLPELAAVFKAVDQQQQQQQPPKPMIPALRSQSSTKSQQQQSRQPSTTVVPLLQEPRSIKATDNNVKSTAAATIAAVTRALSNSSALTAGAAAANAASVAGSGSALDEFKSIQPAEQSINSLAMALDSDKQPQQQSANKEEPEKSTLAKFAKQMKTDIETAKLMEKLYNNWECYESLMIKFKIMKEQDSKGNSNSSLVQQFKDGAAELSARLFNSIVSSSTATSAVSGGVGVGGTTVSSSIGSTTEQSSVKADQTVASSDLAGGGIISPATGTVAAIPALQAPVAPLLPTAAAPGTTAAATPGAADAPPDKPFTNDEMEDLNDELTDLNTSVNTLKHSYGSIIRSLVNMQNRRAKKGAAKNSLAPVTVDESAGGGGGAGQSTTPKIELNITSVVNKLNVNYSERYCLDRFLDESTRDEVFNRLFAEVNDINTSMQRFRALFDNEGYYQPALYAQADFKLTRAEYSACIKVIKDISKVVAQILKAYNTDLLDMFRINSNVN